MMMPSVMSPSVRRGSVCWWQPVTSSVTWHRRNMINAVTKMMLSVTSPSVRSGCVWWCQPASTATSKCGSSDISSDVTKYLWEIVTPPVMSWSTQNHLPQWCCSSHILSVSLPASSVQSKYGNFIVVTSSAHDISTDIRTVTTCHFISVRFNDGV